MPPPVLAAVTVITFVAVPVLPALSATVRRTSKVPAWVNVWVAEAPLPPAVLSPQVQLLWLATPEVASVAWAWKLTRSPALTVVAEAPIEAAGAVRSSTMPSHEGSERLALSAEALWLALLGLSGIAASAARMQAQIGPSGAGLAPEP